MKFKIELKDPDALYASITQVALAEAEKLDVDAGSKGTIAQNIVDNLTKITSKWFEHNEYMTLEVDTKTMTITVLEVD